MCSIELEPKGESNELCGFVSNGGPAEDAAVPVPVLCGIEVVKEEAPVSAR